MMLDVEYMVRVLGLGVQGQGDGVSSQVTVDLSNGRASSASAHTPGILAGLAELPGFTALNVAGNELLDEHMPLIGMRKSFRLLRGPTPLVMCVCRRCGLVFCRQ
jgi:hypothetical protein